MSALATVRTDIGDYLSVLLYVYSLLIFAYIISTFIFAFGVRLPYSRVLDAVLTFLRDVCEPYLRIFRRFIPPFGPLDLSPMIALFALYFLGGLIVSAVRG